MKVISATLGVISGLAVLAAAEALPPDQVPISCATICGPIVELSSKCKPERGVGKRQLLEAEVSQIAKRQDDLEGGEEVMRQIEEVGDMGESEDSGIAGEAGVLAEMAKKFLVVVPAPTSFDAQYSSILNPQPKANGELEEDSAPLHLIGSQTRITPIIVQPTRNTPLATPSAAVPVGTPAAGPPPAAQVPGIIPPSLATTVVPANTPVMPIGASLTQSTTNPAQSGVKEPGRGQSSTSMLMDQNTSDAADGGALDTEARCVCLNRSFDVARVAALCTSCIMKNGDPQTNMQNVMGVCDFSPRNYQSSDDASVNNIRVVANRPPAVWGSNTGVASLAADTRRLGRSAGVAVGAVTAWAVWTVAWYAA